METNPQWVRECPKCGKTLYHSTKRALYQAKRTNHSCHSCRWSSEAREKFSKLMSGKGNPFYGKKLSEKHRANISKNHKGMSGKHHSQETKRKMRLAKIARLESQHGQVTPEYNPEACRTIEEYGKMHGYDFQHAENGGEFYVRGLGFWVDGYDVNKNVVIEVYERSHWHYRKGKLRQRDKDRQKEIEKHLDCKFIVLEI